MDQQPDDHARKEQQELCELSTVPKPLRIFSYMFIGFVLVAGLVSWLVSALK
ncbi:MAG: hypothetical protein K0Q59_5352 [Paenibacillus sp.]|jgi:hypothetical protein|nr:hypothetical protein [Paenibacillus sp.]